MGLEKMGLNKTKLLAALLPSESRESILGDLIERANAKDSHMERGNRLHDYITVIPAAWFALFRRYFAREWTGPIPSFARASDDAILGRAAQLRRAACWSAGLGLSAGLSCFATDPPNQRNLWTIVGVLLPLVCLCAKLLGERRERRRAPLDAYRRALADFGFNICVPMNLWLIMILWLQGPIPSFLNPNGGTPVLVLNVASGLAAAALSVHRFRRLRRERKALA